MNERILKLAEQAGFIDRGTNHSAYMNFDHEKFAELIIFECTKVAIFKDNGMIASADVVGYMAAGRSTAARMIREHFGVKE